jgi:hypothetical protein
MKTLRRVLLVVVLLVALAVFGVFMYLDRIVRSTIEKQASSSLNLPTTLDGASLGLLGGKVNLSQLDIGSPKGFAATHMFELGGLGVSVDYGQLTKEPVRVKQIVITKPKFVLEQADGKMNFKAVMDSLPATDPNAKVVKVVIDELIVNDAVVDVRLGKLPGLGDMKPITVNVPSVTLKNIGNADGNGNGAAIKDVVMQVATALAGKAGDLANLPAQFKTLLAGNLKDVATQLGGEFTKQLGGITQSLQGEIDKVLPGMDIKGDVKGIVPKELDPNKAIGDLLGGNKDKKKDKK